MNFLKVFKEYLNKTRRKIKREYKYIKSLLENISDKRPRNFISFSEAIHLMDESLISKNGYSWHKAGVEWNRAGITTRQFAQTILLQQLPLYQYKRSIYGFLRKIEIPTRYIPSSHSTNKFNNDFTMILSQKGEVLFTSLFVKKSRLKRILKYVKKNGLDFNPVERYWSEKKNDWVYLDDWFYSHDRES